MGEVFEALLGQAFQLEGGQYTVVDVRNIDGDTMVYAERQGDDGAGKGPARAAFRYADIEARLTAA